MTKNHQENGKFAPGNSASPGRPKRQTEELYLQSLRETVTLDAWRAICERAVRDATKGDSRARDWLSRYLLDGNLADRLEALELALQLRRHNP